MDDTTVTITVAGPGDAAEVLAADVFDGPALPQAVARFLADGAANILILARTGGRTVGFASGTLLDHPDKPRALYVQELGVNEAAQRRGIGRALLTALRAEGRARGATATWVLTEGDNTAARALYGATGGAETPGVVMFDWDEGPGTA
jgi:ribosomal protein S18 acetylase RimI-like enzyme